MPAASTSLRTPSRPDPTSRTVLITGASAGIGRALAQVYAAEGWDLILTARRIEPLEALAQGLRRTGRTVHVLTEDLADPAAPERLWKAMQAQGLAIDGLVNNAGFSRVTGFLKTDLQAHRDMLRVMLTAPVELYGDEAARYLCSRRVYSAVPRESGADTELYAYSGSFTASGEELSGEAEISGDGESIRFYADE